MKKILIAALFGTMGLAAMPAASSAMTAARGASADAGLVQDIAYGCPRGYAPNKWGRCVAVYRPDYRYGGAIPANRSGYGRVCPRGTYLGPRGGYCHPRY
ncbi:hypothetical protein LMIY3S_01552 [Labrys miyagiensis]